jgi:hypothetical protein
MTSVFLKVAKPFQVAALALALVLIQACASGKPSNPNDLCRIFTEHSDWYDDALNAQAKWGTPIPVLMAMMYQESSYIHDAEPPMRYVLGFIPIGRASSAYGFAQAKDETWADYQKATGNSWSARDDFEDAIDFMGWFTYKTQQINGVSKWDAKKQYLSYHEGWSGYRRKTYLRKSWLTKVADKVKHRAKLYTHQLKACREDLDDSWF